jgi:HAD superfamily hydrolase (TIGR01549 family)
MAFQAPLWSPSEASAILFDWDGVIAETNLDFSRVKHKYYGDRPAMLLEDAGTLSPTERADLMRDLEELEMRGAEQARPVPGVDQILEWVRSAGIPWAVVSRNCRKSIQAAADAIGVALPGIVRSRDDGDSVKPNPTALIEVCAGLGVPPRDTLLIGDYIYDMMGARRAGMRGALVRGETGDGWEDWLECRCASMYEFYSLIVSRAGIIAWEYKDTAARLGEGFLRWMRNIALPVPAWASPSLDAWVSRAASLGVGCFIVRDGEFTPEMWRQSPSFDVACVGMSLEYTLRDYLNYRWPFAEVSSGGETKLHPPVDSDGLEEYLLSLTGQGKRAGHRLSIYN